MSEERDQRLRELSKGLDEATNTILWNIYRIAEKTYNALNYPVRWLIRNGPLYSMIFVLGFLVGALLAKEEARKEAERNAYGPNSYEGPDAVSLDHCPFMHAFCEHPHSALIIQNAQFACTLKSLTLRLCE